MAITIALASAATATTVPLAVSAIPSGTAAIEIQVSPQTGFDRGPAPVLSFAPAQAITISGLNQAGIYYLRARDVTASGLRGTWGPILPIYTPVQALRSLAPATIMIEPPIIVPPEPVLAWATDTEIAGYPARTLGRDDPNTMWVSRKANGVVAIEAQLSGAPIDTIAVLESTAAEDCMIRVKAGQNAAAVRGSSPPFQTVAAQFRASSQLPQRRGYHSLVRLPVAVSQPYWRVEISGTMPGDLFAATYAVFGKAIAAGRNYASDGKTETGTDAGTLERDRSGNPARTSGFRGRSVKFDLQNLSEAQYEAEIERIRWICGTTDPALVVPNTRRGSFLHDRILFGTLSAGQVTNTSSPLFNQEFVVSSLI